MAEDDGRVVSNFIVQALRNSDITIYGDGTQTRSFCYVDDLVDGLIRLFFQEAEIGPVNLGNPNPITIGGLAEEIIGLTNSNSKITYLPLPGDDPTNREPDISKAREILNWEPRHNREEGLKRTISYFAERMDR
jgi:UDP-glucuronate decarboxylase